VETWNSAQALGAQIRAARKAKGWTQKKLGDLCGVGKAQIAKLESDISHASMALFLKLCDILGFDLLLLDETGEAWKQKAIMTWQEISEINTGENVKRYIERLDESERILSNADFAKALDSVIKFTLTKLNIDYKHNRIDYDYRCNIGNKIVLIIWKMGHLERDEYLNLSISDAKRAFNETNAHKIIITFRDYKGIEEKLNNQRYMKNLVFVPIDRLEKYLKGLLEIQ
jgi:transcriptional regulator with XRE-family HTH domain